MITRVDAPTSTTGSIAAAVPVRATAVVKRVAAKNRVDRIWSVQ
jgi:hypothetical protein